MNLEGKLYGWTFKGLDGRIEVHPGRGESDL
jgi:hypothetical protein